MNDRRGFFGWAIGLLVWLLFGRTAKATGALTTQPMDMEMSGTVPFVSSVHYDCDTMALTITYGGLLIRRGEIVGVVFDMPVPDQTPDADKLNLKLPAGYAKNLLNHKHG